MVISSQIKQFVEHLSQKSDAIFESGSKDSLTKHNNSKKKKMLKDSYMKLQFHSIVQTLHHEIFMHIRDGLAEGLVKFRWSDPI